MANLRQAVALDPAWGQPHNSLAIVLRLNNRLQEAEEEALTALRLEPENIANHNNYANLLIACKRYEEAEDHYRVAIELNPAHPKPYFNLACLCSILGRTDEAIALLQDALKRAPILRQDAIVDPDFEPIRNNPAFRRLVFGAASEDA